MPVDVSVTFGNPSLHRSDQYILTVGTSQSRRRLTKLLAPFCFKCFEYKLETKE